MKNKKIIVLFSVAILVVIMLFLTRKKEYDIKTSFKSMEFNSEKDLNDYLNYIKQQITPKKLSNFVNLKKLNLTGYNNRATGFDILDEMKNKAYDDLFNSLFSRECHGYADCPVTEKFKSKFNDSIYKQFGFIEKNSEISCSIDDDCILVVTESGDFVAGEPGYIYYHHFYYTLDEDGNVDDVIFDYTE